MTTILAIPDTHFPYHHPDTFKFLDELRRKYKPDMVVHLGDSIDSHTISRWDSDPDVAGAYDEVEAASDALAELATMFPKLFVCYGNHCLRALKKAKSVGIPSPFIRNLDEVFGTPRTWKWSDRFITPSPRGQIVFTHGDGFSGSAAAVRAAEANRTNTVIGHVHAYAGVAYSRSVASEIWGMNAGCLIDERALVFAYGATCKNKPVLGAGLIVDGVPNFVPMR